MPLYRKIIIIIANNLFKILLFFTISIVAAVFLYTDRNYLASVLDEYDAYDKVVSALLESNKEQSLTAGGNVTLENEEVQAVIKDAFPSEDLKINTENVIASFYDWLENKEANFNFVLDLSDNKQKLAEGLSSFAINRLQNLPICSDPPQEIDPFSADCSPANFDYETERNIIQQQLLKEAGFLDDPVITQETLFSNSENSSFNDDYRQVPTYFSLLKASPIYISLVLLSLALIVIFASSTRKIGYRKIGRGLVGTGFSLIFFTALFSFVLPRLTGSLPIFQSSEKGIDSLINELSIVYGQDYSLMIIKISTPLIILGSIMIFYSQLNKNKRDYSSTKLKSGVVNSNEKRTRRTKAKKFEPPVQSSESSKTKPKKRHRNKKYGKIPKKEI